ncbi:MAG TPA: hypothetical protein VM843_03135 [Flavisolibacter sp.]|jgi:hypothetical protein|nr:hypothetical protein [Flavisolibacter sp.]
MKKTFLSLAGVLSLTIASAQFDASQLTVGVAGNYHMYKGNMQKSAPGAHVRLGYDLSEKSTIGLGFTYTSPLKYASEVQLMDQSGSTSSVASEITYKFKTFSLMGNYHLIGDNETSGSLYAAVGGGYVMVNYEENITGTYDKDSQQPMDLVEKGSENGLVMNFGLGGQYTIGRPIVFAEAGLALPANKVGNQYVENSIPSHFTFNLGIKLPLGSRDY